jgi:SAM-dependent MidA family methyltransferase
LQQVFEQAYEQADDDIERYRLAQQVKKLTMPDQMGERFQAMLLARGLSVLPVPEELLAADQGDRL